jgi:hypothetical protein
LDGQLAALYDESAAFEQQTRDPSRLQDRSGKGRLLEEEAQRKQFQKSIRKTIVELQKVLTQWEHDERTKFDADLLSVHGRDVRNARNDSALTIKTQLMHLESGMHMARRSSLMEDRRQSGDSDGGHGTPPPSGSRVDKEKDVNDPFDMTADLGLMSIQKPNKPNPFARMMSSKKGLVSAHGTNRVMVEGEPLLKGDLKDLHERENVDPMA